MKILSLASILFLVALYGAIRVQGDCQDGVKDAQDGEVTQWFKNLGCQIKKGAGDLHESAKPWADKIATGAKDFGHTVAQKYDEVKHKLTSDDKPSAEHLEQHTPVSSEPTEKIPLAPLPSTTHASGTTGGTGEHFNTESETATPTTTTATTPTLDDKFASRGLPHIENRFLFQPSFDKCPPGTIYDHTHGCRELVRYVIGKCCKLPAKVKYVKSIYMYV